MIAPSSFTTRDTRALKKLERCQCVATIEKFGQLDELFCSAAKNSTLLGAIYVTL
jgi:hypothetical protein